MTAYQAGIAEFEKAGAVVIGVSTDNVPSLRYWAQEVLKLSFPLASDFARREVARAYGVLNEPSGIANRTTFVIGPDGRIVHIEEGSAALDPEGALTACRRTKRAP
jgi:peroxiredoxin